MFGLFKSKPVVQTPARYKLRTMHRYNLDVEMINGEILKLEYPLIYTSSANAVDAIMNSKRFIHNDKHYNGRLILSVVDSKPIETYTIRYKEAESMEFAWSTIEYREGIGICNLELIDNNLYEYKDKSDLKKTEVF